MWIRRVFLIWLSRSQSTTYSNYPRKCRPYEDTHQHFSQPAASEDGQQHYDACCRLAPGQYLYAEMARAWAGCICSSSSPSTAMKTVFDKMDSLMLHQHLQRDTHKLGCRRFLFLKRMVPWIFRMQQYLLPSFNKYGPESARALSEGCH